MGGMRRLQRGGAGRAAFATAAAADNPDYAAAAGSEASGPRVCILGGGFGGLYTAVKLESLLWPQGTKPKVDLLTRSIALFTPSSPSLHSLVTYVSLRPSPRTNAPAWHRRLRRSR